MLFFLEHTVVSGVLVGVVLALAAVATLIARIFRRPAYYYAALFVLSHLVVFGFESAAGAGASSGSPIFASTLAGASALARALVLLSAILFVRRWYETGREMWHIDRLLRLLVGVQAALPFVLLFSWGERAWSGYAYPALQCVFVLFLAFILVYCCKDAQRDGVQRFFRIGVASSLIALSCLEATGFKAGRGAALGFSAESAYWWGWAALLTLAAQTTTLIVALLREAGREHSLYETEREERNLAEAHAAAEHRRSDALRRANAEILFQQELVERQARQIEGMNNALFENNRQLAEQNLALKELHREKDEMLGIVAHDLKNPLSNIASFASVLQHDDGSLAPSQRGEFLGLIMDSADRMFRIIRNLLDINALERGGVRAHLQAVELSSLLEYGISSYTKRALEKNIAIAMNFQPAPLALGDEHLVMQIFDNLLSNALKYSPFNTTVCVELFAVGDKVRFSVRDEGPGLTEDDKQKLFGKFARLSAEPTGGEHSTGLGLSIVKKMVEMMGGEVWCESESGKGAAFVVELREYKPEEHSAESESASLAKK